MPQDDSFPLVQFVEDEISRGMEDGRRSDDMIFCVSRVLAVSVDGMKIGQICDAIFKKWPERLSRCGKPNDDERKKCDSAKNTIANLLSRSDAFATKRRRYWSLTGKPLKLTRQPKRESRADEISNVPIPVANEGQIHGPSPAAAHQSQPSSAPAISTDQIAEALRKLLSTNETSTAGPSKTYFEKRTQDSPRPAAASFSNHRYHARDDLVHQHPFHAGGPYAFSSFPLFNLNSVQMGPIPPYLQQPHSVFGPPGDFPALLPPLQDRLHGTSNPLAGASTNDPQENNNVDFFAFLYDVDDAGVVGGSSASGDAIHAGPSHAQSSALPVVPSESMNTVSGQPDVGVAPAPFAFSFRSQPDDFPSEDADLQDLPAYSGNYDIMADVARVCDKLSPAAGSSYDSATSSGLIIGNAGDTAGAGAN